jgi:predicted DNA-binding transcriptional regulator AlpA
MSETLLSPNEVERRTSLSRTEIERRVAEGSFPQPIRPQGTKPGQRSGRKFYVGSEIDGWIESQIRSWREGRGPEVAFDVRHRYAERKVQQEHQT